MSTVDPSAESWTAAPDAPTAPGAAWIIVEGASQQRAGTTTVSAKEDIRPPDRAWAAATSGTLGELFP